MKRVWIHAVRAVDYYAAPANLMDPWRDVVAQQRLANDAATNVMPRVQRNPAR